MRLKKYLDWAARETSTRRLVVILVAAGGFFLAGFPLLIGMTARWLDRLAGLPSIGGIVSLTVGIILLGAGGWLALWAVLAEARIGLGTPLPMIPTRRLVAVPPYTYCRNPMALGTVIAYLGLAFWLGSISAILLVLVFGALLLGYVKVFEEKELEARFGSAYLEYKRTTPFLLPRVPRSTS